MEKSHRNRFRLRNLQDQFALSQLPGVFRCTKCARYNNVYPQLAIQMCSFCGNPIHFLEKSGAKTFGK